LKTDPIKGDKNQHGRKRGDEGDLRNDDGKRKMMQRDVLQNTSEGQVRQAVWLFLVRCFIKG